MVEDEEKFRIEVLKAIAIFEADEGSIEDKTLLEKFIANEASYAEAVDILLFLPVAFVRHLLPAMNWSDNYSEVVDEGKFVKHKFNETPSYKIIVDVALHYFNNHCMKETVFKIAGRSASFRTISALLQTGSALKNIDVSEECIVR